MSSSYFKKESKLFYGLQIIIDLLLVNLGFYTAFISRFGEDLSSSHITPYIEIIPLISLMALIFFYIYGVFRCGEKSYLETVYSIGLSLIFVMISSMALAFFNRGFSFPRSIFFIAFGLQLVFLIVWKYVAYKMYFMLYKEKNVMIIGDEEQAENIAKKILSTNEKQFKIRYMCRELHDEVYEWINEVDAVCMSANLDSKYKEKIISYCVELDKTIYIIPELFEITLFNAKLTQFDDVPAFCIENFHLTIEQRFMKRTFDIVVSLIGIILSAPLMVMAYISIKLYDRGPAIFAQERVTRGNKKFKVYKFRTMIMDAEKHTGPVLATDKDPRITPMGGIFRSIRIDELPQLFNVLKGDMSVVGPRPEREFFINEFKKEIPDFQYRVAVKAGVTGLAQVLGKYTTTPKDKLRFDLLYIRNYSFFLDLKIVLQTIKTMFMKASSQGVTEDKSLEELLKSLNYNVYEEIGVTKMERLS
ncbi:MAG: sugar transferase [Marinisporobacter sp.]|jgi:exopolysaccharide biosynthesis polyprenyl glycosylphosphotransferase|nr:sugar transferase [Marinisporobacter sp.]